MNFETPEGRRTTSLGGAAVRLAGGPSPETLLSAVLDSATVAVFVKDRDGRYLLVNRRLAELWGRTSDEIIGRTDFDLFPDSIARKLSENDRKVFVSGSALEVEEETVFGDERRVYYSSKVPLLDARGRTYAVCGIATNITRLKAVEDALRQSKARFRAMADTAPVLIWVSGPDKQGVFFNARWLDFTGRRLEQELGEGWLECIHPQDLPALAECERAFQERRQFRTHFRMRRHDGKYRWMLDTGVPHYDPDGAFTGFIGSCVDITDRVRLEEKLLAQAEALEEGDRRKDEFLAMLGHELRNPMAPLQHVIELFQSRAGSFDPDMQQSLDIADRQLKHLRRIVDDLLDVARITRGQLRLNREPLPLHRAIETAADAVGPAFRNRNQTLHMELPDADITVDGDETRLTQVFVNLLRNASKYSPNDGDIRIEVDTDEQGAVIEVSDSGIGIEPELLPGIFDLFRQSPRSLDRTDGGLGVGLTLVKRLVEMHGGEVTAESEGEGRGSTFTVRLPMTAAAAGEKTSEGKAIKQQQTDEKRRVLVVDDNRDAADSLGMLLEMEGYSVNSVYDGRQALEAATDDDPDIIVLDIGLPEIDGYEVARRLRQQGCTARIVALTGYGQENDVKRARESGFDAHLLKPVDGATLRSTLRDLNP